MRQCLNAETYDDVTYVYDDVTYVYAAMFECGDGISVSEIGAGARS